MNHTPVCFGSPVQIFPKIILRNERKVKIEISILFLENFLNIFKAAFNYNLVALQQCCHTIWVIANDISPVALVNIIIVKQISWCDSSSFFLSLLIIILTFILSQLFFNSQIFFKIIKLLYNLRVGPRMSYNLFLRVS